MISTETLSQRGPLNREWEGVLSLSFFRTLPGRQKYRIGQWEMFTPFLSSPFFSSVQRNLSIASLDYEATWELNGNGANMIARTRK